MARDRDRRGGKDKASDRRRQPKKKVSILDQESVEWIDYKDVNLLRRFMSERAKIRARRVTGNDAQQQRAVARAIRVAREMALLPYSVRQVTHRSKGKGRDREGPMPRLEPTPMETARAEAAAADGADAPEVPTDEVATVEDAATVDEAVESVEADSMTLSHGPVPELKWPAMTMGFGKATPSAFADIQPGDTVRFEFRKGGPTDYELVSVQKTEGAK